MNLLPGYTTKWGNKNVVVADIEGPDYYFTGGTEIAMEDTGLNLGAFEQVIIGVSQSGTYVAYARFTDDGPSQSFKIVVCAVNGGAEVAYGIDLGGETFRALFVCV